MRISWTKVLPWLVVPACAPAADGTEIADEAAETAVDGEQSGEGEEGALPVLDIASGIGVKGAGPNQQWEGIVMTMRAVGNRASLCSASFITDRHLVTAAHCYEKAGKQRVSVRAPTWGNKTWQNFDNANVFRASSDLSVDIAVVDLGAPQAWATPERRFRLLASKPTPADVYIYGYGSTSDAKTGLDGTLRTAPGRAPVRVTDGGAGYLIASARNARVCSGDSGGPAIKEGTVPVIWGINQSFTNTVLRNLLQPGAACPASGAQMRFTSVSANLSFIEKSIGKPCKRVEVDGQQVAQCW